MEEENIFSFVTETTKENFLNSREIILTNVFYNPYSDDIAIMDRLLDEGRFEEVVEYHNWNILLSPRAHLLKQFALNELGREYDGKLELILAQKILESIDLTGDGSLENPYLVTRISDERDFLSYIGDDFVSQSLLQHEDKYFDVITTASGLEIHFDITDCYKRMQQLNDARTPVGSLTSEDVKAAKKKWWKFW